MTERLSDDDLVETVKSYGPDSGVGLVASELLTARKVLAALVRGDLLYVEGRGIRWWNGEAWGPLSEVHPEWAAWLDAIGEEGP